MKSLLTPSGSLPLIQPFTKSNLTAEERITAIDFVNRNNFLFEEFNHDKMISQFTPDAVTRHFHGEIRGHNEVRSFFEAKYPYLIPGVTRHATNHIVDRDEETGGVIVRYHTQLIRVAWPSEVGEKAASSLESDGSLPAIWIANDMVDRLVMTEEGWKIRERYLGPAVTNERMHPDNDPKRDFYEPEGFWGRWMAAVVNMSS